MTTVCQFEKCCEKLRQQYSPILPHSVQKKAPPGRNEKIRGGKKKEMVATTYHTARRLKTIKVV
jgi:hypothetical protein